MLMVKVIGLGKGICLNKFGNTLEKVAIHNGIHMLVSCSNEKALSKMLTSP